MELQYFDNRGMHTQWNRIVLSRNSARKYFPNISFFFFFFFFPFFFFLSFSRSRLIDAMLFTKSKLIRYIYIECLIAKLLGLKSGSSSKQIEISLSTDTMNKFNGELLNFSLASLDRESARKWKVNDVYLYSRQPVHAYTRIFLLQSCKSFLNS